MPVFLFGIGLDEWFKKTFGCSFKEVLHKLPLSELKECLKSVHLVRERTSLNDVVGYAHDLADGLVEKVKE